MELILFIWGINLTFGFNSIVLIVQFRLNLPHSPWRLAPLLDATQASGLSLDASPSTFCKLKKLTRMCCQGASSWYHPGTCPQWPSGTFAPYTIQHDAMIMISYPALREEVQIRLVSLQRFLPLEYSEHTDLLRAHVKGCGKGHPERVWCEQRIQRPKQTGSGPRGWQWEDELLKWNSRKTRHSKTLRAFFLPPSSTFPFLGAIKIGCASAGHVMRSDAINVPRWNPRPKGIFSFICTWEGNATILTIQAACSFVAMLESIEASPPQYGSVIFTRCAQNSALNVIVGCCYSTVSSL